MAIHSSIPAWRIPRTVHGGLQSMEGYSPRVAKSQTQLIDFTSTLANIRASLVGQLVKNPLAVWETWVQSVGWEDPLEKGKATHSSILA